MTCLLRGSPTEGNERGNERKTGESEKGLQEAETSWREFNGNKENKRRNGNKSKTFFGGVANSITMNNVK